MTRKNLSAQKGRRLRLEQFEDRKLMAVVTSGAVDAPSDPGEVSAEVSVHQNPSNRFDVNNDGRVSALDALNVINRLSQIGSRELGALAPETRFVDVNGDGIVSALDILQIINSISIVTSQRVTSEPVSATNLAVHQNLNDDQLPEASENVEAAVDLVFATATKTIASSHSGDVQPAPTDDMADDMAPTVLDDELDSILDGMVGDKESHALSA